MTKAIMTDRRTSITAIVGLAALICAHWGFNLSVQDQVIIVAGFCALGNLLAADSRPGTPAAKKPKTKP